MTTPTPTACAICKNVTDIDGENIMEVFACDRTQDECLNCCGCDDHAGEPWYEVN